MISFHYLNDFKLNDESYAQSIISKLIEEESFKTGEINYIFCSDDYLLKINIDFLNHDTLTDIISFDYSVGKILNGDIYISVDRVKDNSNIFNVSFNNELSRVMFHGILHYCGYKDKTEEEKLIMRTKEGYYLEKLL